MPRSSVAAASPGAIGDGHAAHGAGIGVGAVVLAFVGLSLGSTLVKASGSPGAVVALWRLGIGAAIWHLVIALSAVRSRPGGPEIPRRPYASSAAWRAAALPGFAFGINLPAFFSGVERTPIAHAEFISACAPLVVVPLSAWRLRERVPRQVIACGALALVGVTLILGAKSSASTSLVGDLLVLLSMLAWVTYLLLGKTARQRIGTTEFMAVMSTVAVVTALAITLVTEGPAEIVDLSAKAWLVVAVLGVTTGVMAHGLIAWSQGRVAIGTVSMLQLTQPALGVVWAAIFLDEAVKPVQVAGMALVLAAVATIARRTVRALPTK